MRGGLGKKGFCVLPSAAVLYNDSFNIETEATADTRTTQSYGINL